jgi:oxygen-independent coproporphyrinogen-3 oxidase
LAFESVNVDLIHGLPHQTPERFAQTLDTVVELRPDRIAVYGYAHLPQRFKPQRRIHEADLPSAGDKLAMMQSAIERLGARGYVHIGLDHFALPDDALAVAQRMGVLHRNFMGYTTQPDCDMIGLGVSAIGRIGPSYGQNARMLETWQASVRAGVLPIERGCELSREDMLRRFVIMSMMCNGTIPFAAVERDYLVSAQQVFRDELARLREFEALGLVRIDADGVTATTLGRFFVRPIAMLFDRALRSALPRGQYCRVL